MMKVLTTFMLTIVISSVCAAQTVSVGVQPSSSDWKIDEYDPALMEMRNHLPGIARPRFESVMRAATASSVTIVHVREGQTVRRGDLLLTLNDAVAQAAWKAAKAEASKESAVESARLQWKLAEAQIQRLRRAFQENASSQFELEEKNAQVEQAKAQYHLTLEEANAANAKLELAAAELEKFRLRAPFDGMVVQIDKRLGQPVDPTETALVIVDARELEIEMFLPLGSYGKIKAGMTYRMQASAPVNREVTAKAIFVAPIVDATSGTFRCTFKIDNAQLSLPAGFSVSFQD